MAVISDDRFGVFAGPNAEVEYAIVRAKANGETEVAKILSEALRTDAQPQPPENKEVGYRTNANRRIKELTMARSVSDVHAKLDAGIYQAEYVGNWRLAERLCRKRHSVPLRKMGWLRRLTGCLTKNFGFGE